MIFENTLLYDALCKQFLLIRSLDSQSYNTEYHTEVINHNNSLCMTASQKDLKTLIKTGCIIIKPGQKIIGPYGGKFILTKSVPYLAWSHGGCKYSMNYRTFFKEGWKFDFNSEPELTSNKGRVSCFRCECPTEQRIDFETFSTREFCPRCRI